VAPSILLLQPPGWDACVSGPYSAGPYIKGYCARAGVDCRWVDLNLELFNAIAGRMTSAEAVAADASGLAAMDSLYFKYQSKLEAAAGSAGAWTLRDGFQPIGLDPGASESVRAHLVFDPPYRDWLERRLRTLIDETRPAYVGISITIPQQLFAAFQIARIVRQVFGDLPVVAGGNIVTRLAQEMSLPWVFDHFDALVVGTGEEASVALARLADRREDWGQIPNLRYRFAGEIKVTPPRVLTRALFAQPDYADVDFDAYWGFSYATIMASKGCYYGKCPFCAIPYSWGNGGYVGNDDPALVAGAMLDVANRHGIERFKFVEESMHARVIERVSDALIEAQANFSWEGYVRLDAPWFDAKFVNKAARAGLKKVYAGLELLDSHGRPLFDKQDRPDPEEFLLRMQDAGIAVHLFVLVGHPGTTLEEAVATLDFALERRDLIDTLEINGFRYEKHTSIAGLTRRPDPDRDWAMDDAYDSTLQPSFSRDTIDRIEDTLFRQYTQMAPHWTHPIHYLTSPWSRTPNSPKPEPAEVGGWRSGS